MELNFKTFGHGDPLIILHGLFGTLDNWQTVARHLANHYSVYIVDQRNHGRSPHAGEMNYRALAEDLKHFLEMQWVYKTHILGHSMGGKTGMQFALDFPDMVDKLIVVDVAPKTYPGGHESIFEALFAVNPGEIQDRSQAENILSSYIPDPNVVQFLLKNLSRNKAGSYDWKMNLPVLFKDYPQILAGIESEEKFENPVLFIRGGRSNYIRNEDWPGILRLFPNARLQTIEHAGHWVHADAPDMLLKSVEHFLYLS